MSVATCRPGGPAGHPGAELWTRWRPEVSGGVPTAAVGSVSQEVVCDWFEEG